MFGLPADGKPIALTGNAILAVTPTGKLAHNWIERSAWELYNQLTGIGSGEAGRAEPPGAGAGAGRALSRG